MPCLDEKVFALEEDLGHRTIRYDIEMTEIEVYSGNTEERHLT